MSASIEIRRDRLLAIRNRIDADGGGALHIFGSATPPHGGASAEPPLFIVNLGAVSFELHATEASMSLAVEGNVAISGSPTWARFVDGSGYACMDLAAGLPGSGAPVTISNGEDPPALQMYVGGVVSVACSIAEAP